MLRALAFAFIALSISAAVPARAQDRPSSAEREYSRLNADRAHRIGVQQYRLRQYDAALRQFERAVALAPNIEAYRRSLILTRRRITLEKASDDALKRSVERTRKAFALDREEADAARRDRDGELPGAMQRGAVGGDPRRPLAADDPARPRVGDDNPLSPDNRNRDMLAPDDMRRDPIRDLNLGGGDDMPSDLPVAGSDFGLPTGLMPRDPSKPRPSTIPAYDADAPHSILHGLDEPPGIAKPAETSPGGPRLDRPRSLP